MRYYLGLDNGGTTTKASLFDSTGREIGTAGMSTQVSTPHPGFVERDMEEMWRANCQVIRRVLTETGVEGAQIAAVAVCGHGKGLYLCGEDGRPVRPGILSTDSRAAAYAEGWRRDGTEAALFPITCQHILACQPTALLAWVREHEPEVVGAIRWVFGCKDYVRFRLTGQAGGERTDLSGCGVLNLHTGQYDGAILERLGLGGFAGCFPPLCDSGAVCGQVTEEAAALTGLLPGTPVAGGMFDIDACALALGLTGQKQACMIAGTWSINQCLAPAPVTDGSLMMNSLYCLPGWYLLEESSPTSAGNNEWFIATLLPEARAHAEAMGESIYDVINDWVESVPHDAHCPVFLPFLMGGNTDPEARGCLAGLELSHTRAHIARAIYEGVVFSHRWHFERLRRANGDRLWDCVRLAGGAACSPVWRQMFADALGHSVEAVAVTQTGNLGCAMAAATAAGDFSTLGEAAWAMCPPAVRVMPQPSLAQMYRKKYERYLRVMEACRSLHTAEKEEPFHV